MCAAPFGGVGGTLMRAIGRKPADNNPNICGVCFDFVSTHHGGAEISLSLMFADIRGSTSLAETIPPTEYRALLDRFYNAAAEAIFAHDGFLDKFVGDEVVASFAPLLAGEQHAARAVEAAKALMRVTGNSVGQSPWVPLGAGVHTGIAWMGAVGEGAATSITTIGDATNIAARLSALAEAGEILVTTDAAMAAGMDPSIPRRMLDLRGKLQQTEVISLRV